jgi:hypothetical protein
MKKLDKNITQNSNYLNALVFGNLDFDIVSDFGFWILDLKIIL